MIVLGAFFSFDLIPALIVIASFILFILMKNRLKTYRQPFLFFSNLKPFPGQRTWKESLWKLPHYLLYAALFFFALAFINPYFNVQSLKTRENIQANIPTEGIGIYLLVDQSGSMGESVVANSDGEEILPKIALLKKVTQKFIQGRPNDLVGLVAFARAPTVLSPLTLDHDIIQDDLKSIQVVNDPEQNGTAMGYAIYKTVNMIAATKHFGQQLRAQGKPTYLIENSIIMLITDGFQYPSPLDKENRLRNIDLDEAAVFAKENGVKVYLINIDPNIRDPEFQPQRNLMKRITELTGGQFFMMSDSSLEQIFNHINRLEKSKISEIESESKVQEIFTRKYLYPELIGYGMLLLFISVLLQCTIFKTVP